MSAIRSLPKGLLEATQKVMVESQRKRAIHAALLEAYGVQSERALTWERKAKFDAHFVAAVSAEDAKAFMATLKEDVTIKVDDDGDSKKSDKKSDKSDDDDDKGDNPKGKSDFAKADKGDDDDDEKSDDSDDKKPAFLKKEEVEQIAELSKTKLGDYDRAARRDVGKKDKMIDAISRNDDYPKKGKDVVRKLHKKAMNRLDFVAKAQKKIKEETVDEGKKEVAQKFGASKKASALLAKMRQKGFKKGK